MIGGVRLEGKKEASLLPWTIRRPLPPSRVRIPLSQCDGYTSIPCVELGARVRVGEKIADCVLVLGLGFNNVTPIDVWGKRFLINFYNLNSKMKYEDMRKWIGNYFEGYAGWAGQFLYEYIRNQR